MVVSSSYADFKLVRVNDGFEGETFPIIQHVTTIGRIAENTILLSHKSISRNHAQIMRDGEKIQLVDLNSSNGTYVNGDRLERSSPVDLKPNYLVQFGSVEFVFVPIDEEIDLARYRDNAASKGLIVATLALAVVMIIVGGAVGYSLIEQKAEWESMTHGKNDPSLKEKGERLLSIGKAQMQSGDWVGANKTFETVSAMLPNHPEITKLKHQTEVELNAERMFEKGGKALEEGKLERARTILLEIPPQTHAYTRAQKQLPIIEAKIVASLSNKVSALLSEPTEAGLNEAREILVRTAELEPEPKPISLDLDRKLRARFKELELEYEGVVESAN